MWSRPLVASVTPVRAMKRVDMELQEGCSLLSAGLHQVHRQRLFVVLVVLRHDLLDATAFVRLNGRQPFGHRARV